MFLAAGAALTSLEAAGLASRLQESVITTPVVSGLSEMTASVAQVWFLLMMVASLGLLLGVFPRVSAGTLAAGNALVFLVDLQLYSNHRVLLVLLCTWFVFARSDRSWAPGARRRRQSSEFVPWWPHLLVVATVSSCYFFAGLSKVNPEFLSGATLATLVPAGVPVQAVAWMTAVTEMLIAACLWFPRTRLVAIILGVALHTSIIVLMGSPLVFFTFALLCMTAYPLAGRLPLQPTREGNLVRSRSGLGDPAAQGLASRA